MKYFYN